MADFKEELENKLNEVTKVLDNFAPLEEGHQKRVLEAVNYSFMAGGKRLRPMFVIESFRLFNGTDFSVVTPFMAAIEMVHTYSLIHDDLPMAGKFDAINLAFIRQKEPVLQLMRGTLVLPWLCLR